MIRSNHHNNNTAKVNHTVAIDIDNNRVHNSLLDRLKALSEASTRQRRAESQEQNEDSSSTGGTAVRIDGTTPLEPPLLPPMRVTRDQRLLIAQTEWKKLLSQRSIQNRTYDTRQQIFSAENQRENNYWGDSLGEKGNNVTRVYSLNVNGLSIDRRGGRFGELCKVAQEVQADNMLSRTQSGHYKIERS